MRGSMTAVPTILVVDDEPHIVRLVRDYLERAGLSVLTATRGDEALRVARTRHPDLVVLDLGLPGVDGLDVTKALRREPATAGVPIIVLTARGDESDRIVGLELGADDYVTKPFSPRELAARVKAVLRRAEAVAEPGDTVRVGEEVVIDLARREARFGGRVAELTPTEFELVATMARQPGRVFTRAQLLDVIHGVAIESYERAIDAHVKNIRRKIEPDARTPRYLVTAFGVGYRFADLRS
jgi:two-component system alkaline phosphatase synthesis response regulator PhoP